MNSEKQVKVMVEEWKEMGLSKGEIVVKTAEAELGWSYVWGAVGAECTPAKRRYYAGRSVCPSGESDQIYKTCPVLNGTKSVCNGCQWYPGGERTLCDDCQGFVKQIHSRVGITLKGGGATSMWKDDSNWQEKGEIKDIPKDKVCCVFQHNSQKNNMQHVGEHIGGGEIIHCSKTVKRGKITDKGWTHYAIPKGIDGDIPVPPTPTPSDKPTLRLGSTGVYVVELQNDLIQLGYSVGSTGADGKFGKNTEAAVKAFQKDHPPLIVDGIVGRLTWSALDEAIQPQPEPPVEQLYTVTIQHLDKIQAMALCNAYPNASMKEEGLG